MFTELEQGSSITIEVLRSLSTQECYQVLREAFDCTEPTQGVTPRSFCHEPLAQLGMGNSGTTTVLNGF